MPDTLTCFVNASIGGRTYATNFSINGDNKAASSPTVTPAKAGALTTRTDGDTGSVTMVDSGHGITTAAKVDVYWTVAGVDGARRNMTVGTVSGTTVPIDGGSGDNLPVAATALALKVPQSDGTVAIVGANVVGIAIKCPSYRGQVVLRKSDGTEILAATIKAGESYVWSGDSSVTNPVTGNTIDHATFSHADLVGSQEMPLEILYN